jgi:uncharacterized protein YcbX
MPPLVRGHPSDTWRERLKIKSLHLYPIKSCAGIQVDRLEFDRHGPVGDRRYVIIDEKSSFLSQRVLPKMALIEPILEGATLSVRLGDKVFTPTFDPKSQVAFSLRKFQGNACPADSESNTVLSDFLGKKVTLLKMNPEFDRTTTLKEPADSVPVPVSLVDSFPVLVISQASLDLLNSKLSVKIPMNRFRPNIVLEDTEAHFEDTAQTLSFGAQTLNTAGKCMRCIMTTIDQETGTAQGPEPLATLATYRKTESGIAFGSCFYAGSFEGIKAQEVGLVTTS